MAVISGWWPSVNGDRKYYIEQQAAVNAQIYSNGVLPVGHQFQVLATEGLSLNVTAGYAWINGYWILSDADYPMTLEAPDGVMSRVDRVVVRWQRNNRETVLAVKKGNAGSQPVGAALQRDADVYELCIAEIAVTAGATHITQADITDTRPDNALCGLSGVYDPPVATEWFAQFEASFLAWFENMQGVLEGDVAASLINAVSMLRADVDAQAEVDTQQKTAIEDLQEDVSALKSKKELPTVTTADNGKFLRVVNGAWAAVAMTDADEVSY